MKTISSIFWLLTLLTKSRTSLAFLTLFSSLAFGAEQSPTSTLEKLERLQRPAARRIGPFTELSDKQILGLHQDKSGFMWIATVFELYRYDGVEFIDYTPKFQLPENRMNRLVLDLAEDADGNLWIGCSQDLYRYNPRRDEIEHMKGVGPATRIVIGPHGRLFVFTNAGNHKVFRFINEALIEEPLDLPLEHRKQNGAFRSVAFDENGNGWLVHREGLIFPLRAGENEVTISPPLPSKLEFKRQPITVECLMHDGNLWIGTDPEGLFRVDIASGEVSHFGKRGKNKSYILGGKRIDWMQIDWDGDLWVGLKDGGLKLYIPEEETFRGLTFAKGRIGEEGRLAPSSASFDENRNLWIGTRDVGLFHIDSTQNFLLYEHLASNSFDHSTFNILGMLETKSRNLWVSVRGIGLSLRRPGKRLDTNTLGTSPPTQPHYIEEDSKGRVWINTVKGLFRLNPLKNRFEIFPVENAQDTTQGPLLAVGEKMWVAFGRRLICLDTDTGEIIDEIKETPGAILYLYEDHLDRLWIGFRTQLYIYDTKERRFLQSKWEHIPDELDFNGRRVTGVKALEDGSAWLSLFGRGMMLLDPSFEVKAIYDAENGMPSEAIEAFQIDNEGILWMGTRFGLVSLDPSTGQINQYLEKDGLIDNRFAPGDCQKTHDGSILFKTMRGLLRVYPQNQPQTPQPLTARLTGISVLGADVPIGEKEAPLKEAILFAKEITLSKKQGVLTLSYSANSYKNLGKTWFRWRLLKGQDVNWTSPSLARSTTLSDLPPGTYVWEVQASSDSHQWEGPIRRLTITIQPSIWTRWWALASIAIVAIGIIVLIVYAYNRHQIRRSRRLERLIEDRTQEIAGKNSELEEKTEELTATTTTLSSTLHQLQEMQDQLVETARTTGKAEIATNVLHSVGNVLNSLNVSVGILSQRTENSHAIKLSRLADMVQKHQTDLAAFISSDPRGKNVPNYLIQLSKVLEEEVASNLQELGAMNDDIEHIKNVIAAQQTHAKSTSIIDEVAIRELCDNALSIIGSERSHNKIKIVNEVPARIVIKNDKHRLLDITLNLISNAIDAIDEQKPEAGLVTLRAQQTKDASEIELTITDNGVGIAPEVQEKLFQHGFTTKAKGHGFGLHSCAIAANVLGGHLTLSSPGKGLGATATLSLPLTYSPQTTSDKSQETTTQDKLSVHNPLTGH